MSYLPEPRGEISGLLIEHLRDDPHAIGDRAQAAVTDPLTDDDLHLALYLCYELHYRGLPGVDARWEWEPSLLELRRDWETAFEDELLAAIGAPVAGDATASEMDLALRAIVDGDDSPSLSTYFERHGTLDQMLEFVVHRSAYQLKEADPHSWAIPRLFGPPKAALIEVQFDEYGGGRAECMHAELFAVTMDELGLDRTYGAYLSHLPGVTLATVNLMSLLGLHRRWRGAIAGHLAAFEMTSSLPNRRYANALRRLGFDGRATDFFDEHVEADAVHENVAAVDLAGGLAHQEPAIAGDILWGARALVDVEGRWARHMLGAWETAHSSLLIPLAAVTA